MISIKKLFFFKNNRLKLWILLSCFIFALIGFYIQHDASQKKPSQLISYPISTQHLRQSLYFTGTIQPLNETSLICPAEAIVEKIEYNYGQFVNKGDVVFILNSHVLEKQYNETLMEYLKSKDSFDVAQSRFNGIQELWDTGLISRNNYESEKSSLNTAYITLIQANKKLNEIWDKIGDGKNQAVSKLTMTQLSEIQQVLNRRHHVVYLKAPVSGILLYPPKFNSDKANRITIGSTIKADQVVSLIGDVSGVRVDIDIPETDIHKVHVGMAARITGAVFGAQYLKGRVISINTQALTGGLNSLPFFSAVIEARNLSENQRAMIKIGTSASIELIYDQEKQLLIPIKAIKQVDGKKQVTLRRPDGTHERRYITTGAATADQVVVEKGLKEGDCVVYDA